MKVSFVKEAGLNELISTIGKQGKELDKMLHTAVCSIAKLCEEQNHGGNSVQYANKLIKSVSKGTRVNALIKWLTLYAGLKYLPTTKDEEGQVMPAKLVKGKASVKVAEGMDNPFWTLLQSEGSTYHAFDFDKALKQLIARAEKAHEHKLTKGTADAVTAEQIHKLKALAKIEDITVQARPTDGVAK